jgi:hypothetical protein
MTSAFLLGQAAIRRNLVRLAEGYGAMSRLMPRKRKSATARMNAI